MPSDSVFSMVFFWNYNIIMYFIRYSERVNTKVVVMMYIVLFMLTMMLIFGSFMLGVTYLYQSFISVLFSFSYLIMCITFDNEILDRCEKIGFIVRSSRKNKFYLFFACIGLFFSAFLLTYSLRVGWQNEQTWVINIG
jgi:hypothetical protein